MVEPDSSSRVALPDLRRLGQPGDLGRAVPEVARLGMLDHRHDQPGRRLRGDADMDGAVPVDDAGLVVEQRVDAGLVGDRLDHRPHQERQQGQLRPVGALLLVQRGAQFLERGDVDLLDIGDVRDARLGERHLLGDLAAQPDDLDVLDRVVGGRGRACPGDLRSARRNASRSSWVMRPAGPVPATWRRSMPASRARSRTAGEASGFSPAGRGAPVER